MLRQFGGTTPVSMRRQLLVLLSKPGAFNLEVDNLHFGDKLLMQPVLSATHLPARKRTPRHNPSTS